MSVYVDTVDATTNAIVPGVTVKYSSPSSASVKGNLQHHIHRMKLSRNNNTGGPRYLRGLRPENIPQIP